MLRQRLQTSHVEMGERDEWRETPFEIGLSGDKERAKDRDEQLGPEDVFSPMPPSEGLKMLVSTMMTGHDDGNHVTVHSRWPRGMCREHTFMVKLAGGFTRIYLKDMSKLASWPDFAEACTERVTQRQFGETHGQMC